MNYNNLSVKELVHYLDLYNDDPLVRRLVVLLREESLIEELEAVGMDPATKEFKDEGWNYRGPAEYIEHLRNEIDYYVREADDLQTEVHNLEKEVAKLSARGVASLLAEVHDTLEAAKMEEGRYRRMAEHEKKLREEAEHKFEFWEKLNHGIKS
jgi:predicted RNase H-like nuclease (RuvC/YqgF family)